MTSDCGHDDYGDFDHDAYCRECGSSMTWEDCWNCGGEGYSHHNCGEDCCCCLYPEDNVLCDICNGEGGYWICLNAANHPEVPK